MIYIIIKAEVQVRCSFITVWLPGLFPPPWPRLSRARSPGCGSCFLPCPNVPHHDFEIGQWLVTAWAGPAFVRWAVREERGQIYCATEIYCAPEVSLEITNRYNENDRASKRVHELAFGNVVCFGSEHPRSHYKGATGSRGSNTYGQNGQKEDAASFYLRCLCSMQACKLSLS